MQGVAISKNVPKSLVSTETIDGLTITTCMIVFSYTIAQPDYADKHPEEFERIKTETEKSVKGGALHHIVSNFPRLSDEIRL